MKMIEKMRTVMQASAWALMLLFLAPQAHATEEFLVPFPEDHTLDFLDDISSDASCNGAFGPPNPDEPINTITDFVVRVNNSIIVVDHWEDGYEADLNAIAEGGASLSATTRVYGDGDVSNGAAPGVTLDADDVLTQGQVVVFEESIDTGTQLNDIEVRGLAITGGGTRAEDGVDGGDRIFATETINVTRAQWAGTYDPNDLANSQSGTLFAGAFELFPRSQWGESFTLPVGEDAGAAEFEWVGVTIMAGNDNTTISVDANADGDFLDANDIDAVTIQRGETIEVAGRNEQGGITTGGMSSGARIFSSDIVQVNVVSGQECSNYASRWFTLFPDALLGNTYYEPVSTPLDDETLIYLYNPSINPLTINWETSAGIQTPILVPPQTSVPQIIPAGTGAKFFTGTSATFGALTVTDGGDTAHDWGHASTSNRLMGNIVQVGYAEGDDPSSDAPYLDAFVSDGLLNWFRFDGAFAQTFNIAGTVSASGTSGSIDLSGNTGDNFGLIYTGFILLDEAGVYTFETTSKDGSRIDINGVEILDNDTDGATTASGTFTNLEPGWYPIRVEYRELTGAGENLSARIQGPSDGSLSVIPSNILNSTQPVIGENGSPVWLIADNLIDPSDTEYEICVDVAGDGGANTDPNTGRTFDYQFTLERLDSARLYDGGRDTPNNVPANIDGDQSGMLAFVCDGSEAILAAAWGQDPNTASGAAPAVDVGTTVRSVSADVAFIGDTIFEDLDGDGVRDPGEPGIENITVILTPPAGVNLGQGPGQPITTTTDFNGSYLFTNLTNGGYQVEVIPPSGYVQSFDPDAENGDPVILDNISNPSILNANGRLDQDFGYTNGVPVGQIGDTIYEDTNGNGIQDASELGIAGIDVELCSITPVTSPVAADDFSVVSYSNNSADWASDWIEVNDDNSAATATNGNQGFFVTAGGELSVRGNGTVGGPSLTRQVDLSGFTSGTFSFSWRGADDAYEAGDEVYVETSTDGVNFSTLLTFEGIAIDNATGTSSIPLFPVFGSSIVFVRIRVNQGNFFGGGENFFIDNVVVTGDTTAETCSTLTTNASGMYLFTGQAAGVYSVTVLNPPVGAVNTDDPGNNGDNTNQLTLTTSGGNLEQDFGYFVPATVIGHIYFDTNGNGVQDLGEPNIPNLDVLVTDSLGNLQVVTTDANGDYTASVPPGSTQVNIDENDPQFPTGFIQTDGADPTVVTAVAGSTVDAGDDGYFQGNAIGDTVYLEVDGTLGAQGAGDPGISNLLVTLTPPAGVDIGAGPGVAVTQLTDSNGNYNFVGLPDGTYTVTVSGPTGHAQTEDPDGGNDSMSVVPVSGGTTNNDQDFGYQNNVPVGVIGDRIFSDTNGNGVQDGVEPGIAGIIVQICGDLDDDNGTANTCRTETTDADGDYLFGDGFEGDGTTANPADGGLPATDGAEVYTVTVTNPPTGQTNTADPDGGLPNFSQLTLAAGGGNLDQDFGYSNLGTVSGHLYIDTNGDGDQDVGEPDLVNVDVVITDSNGSQQTVTTDGNGDYSASVPAGTTVADVDETDPQYPANHIQTEGTEPTTVTAVAGTDTDAGIDGYAPAGQIGDLIFFDSSTAGTTGVYEPGIDAGIPAITVSLLPPAGVDLGNGAGIAVTTVSDSNGNYSFGSLPAGSYQVSVTPPSSTNQTVDPNEAGVCATCDNTSTIVIAAGESNLDQDFGYQSIVPPGICPATVNTITFDEYTLATANSTTIFNSEYATSGADNTASPLVAGKGFTISAIGGGTNIATVYNTAPTTGGNDPDLEFADTGNALIVQEAASGGVPNTGGVGEGGWIPDDPTGGRLIFDFETPLTEFSVTLVDYEGLAAQLIFTDTSTGVSVTITHAELTDDGLPATGPFEQDLANCPAPADEAVCVMNNSITAAELAAFGGVVLERFDRVEYQMTASGALDDLNFVYDCTFGTVGDRVFEDTNSNSVQDAGEPGIAGIIMQICGDLDDNDATPNTCRTETTDADGDYLFGDGFLADGVTPDPSDTGIPGTTGTEDYTITVLNPPANAGNTADPDGGSPNVAQLTLPGGISNLDQDFGYVANAITGNVSEDTDGDGTGDTGLSGVVVQLYSDPNGDGNPDDGALIAQETTDANGDYSFTFIPAGDYVLVEIDPAGLRSVNDGDSSPDTGGDAANGTAPLGVLDNLIPVTLEDGEIDANNDFVDANSASIEGTVWFDEDLDGIQDIEESGITGVTVQLINSSGTVVATTTTDANGNYSFENVSPDDYTVNVIDGAGTPLADLDNTAGAGGIDPKPVTVEAGDTIKDIDFGYIPEPNEGAIGDRVWADANNNGIQDPGEAGIEGVVLTLTDSSGAQVGSTVTTNANGDYLFTGVPFGEDYIVSIDPSDTQLAGYTPTVGPQSEGGYVGNPVTLESTLSVVTDVDFGFDNNNLNTVRDTVWFDADADGIKDPDENGIPNVTVDIINAAGDVVATAVTDANGDVAFTGLPDGTYRLVVTDNDDEIGVFNGTTDEGVARISDAVSVSGGADVNDNSFGYNNPGLISGTVYADTNGDSNQTGGEAGIEGQTVTLLLDADNNGSFETTVTSTTTDLQGGYEFDGLPPGNYQVVVTPPGGTQTEDPDASANNQTDINLGIGESSVGNDFGYTNVPNLFDLSGTVFLDPDKDGVEDAGEPGFENVSLALIDRNDINTFDIINGMIDTNRDGVVTGADDGTVEGVAVIDSLFDIDGDGDIDEQDNGTVSNGQGGTYDVVAGMINLAQAGTAQQSSTLSGSRGAENSNDGEPAGGNGGPNYSHTAGSAPNQWWEIDLGSVQSIGEVTIFNRDDCCEDRLGNVAVLVSDTPFVSGAEDTANFNAAVANATANGARIDLPTITNGDQVVDFGGVEARYLRLQKSGTNPGLAVINIAEVKITPALIKANSDGVIATTVTDANGDYSFTGLPDGDYSVAVTDTSALLAGYDITSGLDVQDETIAGADVVDVDFGYIKEEATGSIAGEVWIDENSDGFADDNEFNLTNVDVHLCRAPLVAPNLVCNPSNPNFVATTTTDANGDYIFTDLPPGQYTLDTDPADIPAGLDETVDPTPSSSPIDLSEGEDVTEVDFGHEPTTGSGVLSGFVWVDVDNDGIYDPGEAPIGGVTIEVYDPSTATVANPQGDVLYTTTTNPDGTWIVPNITGPNLKDGLLVGYVAADVDPNAGADLNDGQPTNLPLGDFNYFPVDLASDPDNNISFLDFGFNPEPAADLGSISGTLYSDADQNGDYAIGTDGEFQGVTLNLVDGAGNVVATTMTDENGFYQFTGLQDDTYMVVITDIDNVTKDLNPLEIIPTPIVITGGNDVTEQDAGFISDTELFSIGNRFFFDTNNNGQVDDNEPGIPGVTVQCWLDADESQTPDSPAVASSAVVPQPGIDNLIRTVKTDENGEYYCTSLPAGQYIVTVADAGDFDEATDGTLVTGNVGDNFAKNWSYALTLSDSAPNYAADFGVTGSNSLSGTIVIEDESLVEPDDNGTLEPTELDGTPGGNADSPAANVPVALFVEQNGEFVQLLTTTTDGSGFYEFTNLPDGNYRVEVLTNGSPIDGFGQTGDPDLASEPLPEDRVCDSPTAVSCDNASPNYSLSGGASETGVDFAYQRNFATTPVTMNFFSAVRNGTVVEFNWETSNEVGHAGFQIYARYADDWVLLTPQLITGSGGQAMDTRSYTFQVATDAEWFALVDVSNQEEVIPHGPFRANQSYGANMEVPDEFDWSELEAALKPSVEETRKSVDKRIRDLIQSGRYDDGSFDEFEDLDHDANTEAEK